MGKLENLARERIIRWRKQHRVSQERLGQVTGTHQTTVGKWEKGDASVDIDTLSSWARFFGHTLFDLVAHEDLSESPDADFVAAYNAVSDDAKAAILGLLKTFPGRERGNGGRSEPKRGGKRGTG